jgi:hypothetical protein
MTENKCCNNCDDHIRKECFLISDIDWDVSKDYCSRWTKKQESEEVKILNKMHEAVDGEYSVMLDFISRNYINKEKLIRLLDSKTCNKWTSDYLIDFINDQTKDNQ